MSYAASIVIPLLRQVDVWLEQCVLSALRQSVPTEVVVVRSELTPQSNREILERLQRQHTDLKIFCERKSGSFPNAINTGFECAQAHRVGLLLSDDWLDESTVATCIHRSADIVSTGNTVYFPDGRVNKTACRTPSWACYQSLDTLEAKAAYLEHFFLFRREAVLRVGLDETIGNSPGIDDYDFIWTLLERGATVAMVEKRLYHYRDHEGERLTLGDPGEMSRNLEKILQKHGVGGQEAQTIIARHARWYGKPIHVVMKKSRGILDSSRARLQGCNSGLRLALQPGLARLWRLRNNR